MKAFAFVLLCALAAVQGRYHELPNSRAPAALGDAPWVVHLRIAVSTSGLLNSCVGSLINESWVLTSASCIADARFVWVRYGAVNVFTPSLVTESSNTAVRVNGEAGLISINRNVLPSDDIAPIPLAGEVGDSGQFCGYGGEDGPGEQLSCYKVGVSEEDGKLVVSSDEVKATKYDSGAPLVSNGSQVAVLVGESDENVGEFVNVADYVDWIEAETGVSFRSNPEAVKFVQ